MKPTWQRLTLRHRTALIITLFIWITAVSIGWICRSSFQYLLLRQTDSDLVDDVKDFLGRLDNAMLPFDSSITDAWNRRVAIHPLHRLFIRVTDPRNELIWESITAPPALLRPTPIEIDRIQQVESYRFIQQQIHLRFADSSNVSTPLQKIDAFLQVGYSVDLVANTIAQFDRWLLGALAVLVLGAPVVASLLSLWLLKPLTELTETTRGIALESLRLIDRNGNGDEIDGLAETLNTLLVKVRSQLRENEDWIANSAHQLRSPLAAIISNVEVVARRVPDGKANEMLQRVLTECEYLKRLVNQLLLLGEAKADRQRSARHEVAWNELVEKSSDFYEAMAQSRDLRIRFTRLDRCAIEANPEQLRFVIHNLIDNAIKYTPAGGVIDVDLRRDEAANCCRLCIRDTGIGISPEDLPKVGRRFFRSNSGRDPSQTPRGTGLGLHIVRTIVESMGGSLEIQSRLGEGTEVRVSLPRSSGGSCEDAPHRSETEVNASETSESNH